jgi:hypothetical protein
MQFVKEFQIELPNEFPAVEYRDYVTGAKETLLPEKGPSWAEFAGASNLIGWRFRACFEDMSAYLSSWRDRGANVDLEEVYQRERWLFGMFTAGVSCLESTTYSIHALASHPKVVGVPFGDKEQKSSGVGSLRSALANSEPAEPVVKSLTAILKSGEWKTWVDFRNRMTHRSNLPRIIKGSAGSAPPPAQALEFAGTSSTRRFSADEQGLVALYTWLSHNLQSLLAAGALFARA